MNRAKTTMFSLGSVFMSKTYEVFDLVHIVDTNYEIAPNLD